MRLTSYAVCAALTLYNLSSGTEALAVPVSEEPLEALPENHGRRAALREQMLGPAPAKRASAPIDIMSNTTVVDDPQTLGDDDVGPPPDPSLPDSVSNPDIGSLPDALDFYSDPSSTVGSPLGSIPEIPEKTWDWPTGNQKRLRDLSQDEVDELWEAAGTVGLYMRGMLDHYVSVGRNRIDDYAPADQPKDMDVNYAHKFDYDNDLDVRAAEVDVRFTQSGITFPNDPNSSAYTIVAVTALGIEVRGAVLQVAINANTGTLISLTAFAGRDSNEKADRLRSSELTWQSWKMVATSSVLTSQNDPEQSVRRLKYVMRHNVINQESENIMKIAHFRGFGSYNADGSHCVTDIPMGRDGKPLGPAAGHGRWHPDHPAYNFLLSTPNIKPIVHMLVDHNTELDNNYITEIHTIPGIRNWVGTRALKADLRESAIVLVLGPKPPVRSQSPMNTASSMNSAMSASVSVEDWGTIDEGP